MSTSFNHRGTRGLAAALALLATAAAAVAQVPDPGPGSPSGGQRYVAPRTPWGDPDLEGLWPALEMQGTPYERPTELGTRATLTDAEFAQRAAASARQAAEDAEQTRGDRPAQRTGTGPPAHWGERGRPNRQTSLVVDPPDGRIPPMTAAGKARVATARSTYWHDFPDAVVAHAFDTFEDLGPYDRCITRGLLASMLPTGYNMGTRILQYPGHVVIQNEMIHEVRDIPLDGRPHIDAKIRSYMGDSRGRWEGDTLVVETRNFNGRVGLTRNGNTLMPSADLRLVERLTRVDAHTLQYTATVHDPATWIRDWTVSLPLTEQPDYQMFEYACHEGNYAVRHILSAERAIDRAQAADRRYIERQKAADGR